MQQQYLYCRGLTKDLIEQAQKLRSDAHNAKLPEDRGNRIQVGDEVWLFIDQVHPGSKRKLAHLWHGPFRVIRKNQRLWM